MTTEAVVAFVALVVSVISLGVSIHFWRRSFRPIVTAIVKTHSGGNVAILYDLVLLNSGMIPAKNVKLSADERSLAAALRPEATLEDKTRWLACFSDAMFIPLLQNGDRTSCSFGMTQANHAGFWRYKAVIDITIAYEGWFGKTYEHEQEIYIVDSESFTDGHWSQVHH